ncbi:MAG: VCBS repeat-containing protein, partial [Isosphaeraceae bacterium]
SHSTYLSAFKLDGTLLWRYENDDTIETGPVVGDLDGDGKNEIVFTSGISRSFVPDGGFMTILNGNGSARSRTHIGEVFYTSPALADLNGDGKLEIIASASSYFDQQGVPGAKEAGNRVYAFDYRGKILPGWPYHTTTNDALRRQSYASPVVADLNGDFQLEVINVDQSGVVHVIQANGQPFPGWAGGRPIFDAPDDDPNNPLKSFGTPIIADVDGDGKADIVASKAYKLVAFNLQGQKIFEDIPVIPGQIPESILTSVAVGNLDNSGGLDMVLLSHNSNANRPGLVSFYHLDPSSLTPPWPMQRRSPDANAVRQSLPYLADFVRGSYRAFLGRDPSTSEFLFQVYAMEANTYTPKQLAGALSQTNESRGHVADEMYRQYLDRAPNPSERAYLAAQLAIRRQRDLALVLVNTGEFIQKGGSVEGVIDRLYQRIIGRPPTQAEVASAIQLAIKAKSLVPIGNALLNAPEAVIRRAQSIYQAAFGSANIAPDAQSALILDQHAGRREEDVNAAILFSKGNYAATNAQAGYIRTLYRDLLNREASPLEVGNLLNLFDAGTLNQGGLAHFLLNTGEARALFVREAFRTYLGREASPGDVVNLGNYA